LKTVEINYDWGSKRGIDSTDGIIEAYKDKFGSLEDELEASEGALDASSASSLKATDFTRRRRR